MILYRICQGDRTVIGMSSGGLYRPLDRPIVRVRQSLYVCLSFPTPVLLAALLFLWRSAFWMRHVETSINIYTEEPHPCHHHLVTSCLRSSPCHLIASLFSRSLPSTGSASKSTESWEQRSECVSEAPWWMPSPRAMLQVSRRPAWKLSGQRSHVSSGEPGRVRFRAVRYDTGRCCVVGASLLLVLQWLCRAVTDVLVLIDVACSYRCRVLFRQAYC